MNPTTIKIKIGESGDQFLQRNNLPAKGHIDKQPAGLSFYEHDWSIKTPGTIIVEHGKYSFQIPHALSVTGTEDIEHIDAGLAKFHIGAGITAADTIMHDDAKKELIKFVQQIVSLGWKQYFFYQDPRLTGEQAFRYFSKEDNFYGMPVNYEPTIEQWMQISHADWYLYAEDVFLTINVQRDKTRIDPTKPGAYFLSINLQSKEEEAKDQFEGDDREQWQELWVDTIKSLKKERYAKEKELIQRGFTIYTEYQEPKIHPLDPVEP